MERKDAIDVDEGIDNRVDNKMGVGVTYERETVMEKNIQLRFDSRKENCN